MLFLFLSLASYAAGSRRLKNIPKKVAVATSLSPAGRTAATDGEMSVSIGVTAD